jgi:acid stress chaperone HdeB
MWKLGRTLQGAAILVLTSTFDAPAQVTIDMAKVTCEQYVLYKIPNSDFIPFWIQGYYSGKQGNTMIDTQRFKENAEKVKQYCRISSNVPIMQAVETVLGPGK